MKKNLHSYSNRNRFYKGLFFVVEKSVLVDFVSGKINKNIFISKGAAILI